MTVIRGQLAVHSVVQQNNRFKGITDTQAFTFYVMTHPVCALDPLSSSDRNQESCQGFVDDALGGCANDVANGISVTACVLNGRVQSKVNVAAGV